MFDVIRWKKWKKKNRGTGVWWTHVYFGNEPAWFTHNQQLFSSLCDELKTQMVLILEIIVKMRRIPNNNQNRKSHAIYHTQRFQCASKWNFPKLWICRQNNDFDDKLKRCLWSMVEKKKLVHTHNKIELKNVIFLFCFLSVFEM